MGRTWIGLILKKVKTYEERIKKMKFFRIKETSPEEDLIMVFWNVLEDAPWKIMGLFSTKDKTVGNTQLLRFRTKLSYYCKHKTDSI